MDRSLGLSYYYKVLKPHRKNKMKMPFKSNIHKFNQYETAMNWTKGTTHPSRVFNGDDGLYWVVSGSDVKRLLLNGYEFS